MRQDLKKRKANRLKKERLKDLIKMAIKEPTKESIKNAISFVDKAAKTKIIHKKKASRLKSRLAKILAQKHPKAVEGKRTVRKKRTKKVPL